MNEASDATLMSAIAHGDERAFAALYQRYGQRMYRFFYRTLGRDAEKAADFTQDLFVKLLEKGHTYQPERTFSTWLYTVAHNMCKNDFRKNYPIAFDAAHTETMSEADGWLPEHLDQPLLENLLRASIDQLEIMHRQCFILRYQEALSVREISEIIGCPEGTVKSRLHYALKKITANLKTVYQP